MTTQDAIQRLRQEVRHYENTRENMRDSGVLFSELGYVELLSALNVAISALSALHQQETPCYRLILAVSQAQDARIAELEKELQRTRLERSAFRGEAEAYIVGFGRTAYETAEEHVASIKAIIDKAEAQLPAPPSDPTP